MFHALRIGRIATLDADAFLRQPLLVLVEVIAHIVGSLRRLCAIFVETWQLRHEIVTDPV